MIVLLYNFSLRKASKVFFENKGNKDVFINEKIIKTIKHLITYITKIKMTSLSHLQKAIIKINNNYLKMDRILHHLYVFYSILLPL